MTMKLLIIFGLFLNLTNAAIKFNEVSFDEWEGYKQKHDKSYESEVEENFRYSIYTQNKRKIEAHNLRYLNNETTFTQAINEFADMTHLEFLKSYGGVDLSFAKNLDQGLTFALRNNLAVPNEIDWRVKGAVSTVKFQRNCNSCYSFSALGSVEGQFFRKTRVLNSLSSQNIVDCSQNQGNNGCYGGWMTNVYQYIKVNKGIDTTNVYPYEGVVDRCRYNQTNSVGTVRDFVNLPTGNEKSLKLATAAIGPISVAIDFSRDSFQFYSDGFYYEPECDPNNLGHALLVVGYGTDPITKKDYWIVKNSWGTSWGQNGYIHMARNQNNNCGIATAASYPVV